MMMCAICSAVQLPVHEQLPLTGTAGPLRSSDRFMGSVAKPALVTWAAAAWSCVSAASQCSLHAHMAALQDVGHFRHVKPSTSFQFSL